MCFCMLLKFLFLNAEMKVLHGSTVSPNANNSNFFVTNYFFSDPFPLFILLLLLLFSYLCIFYLCNQGFVQALQSGSFFYNINKIES